MTAPLTALVEAIDRAFDDTSLVDDAARIATFLPAFEALLAHAEPLPAWAYEPYEGRVIGNLVHRDHANRYHVMVVVVPEGASTGIHQHGTWTVSGSLTGGDEDTRYEPLPRGSETEVRTAVAGVSAGVGAGASVGAGVGGRSSASLEVDHGTIVGDIDLAMTTQARHTPGDIEIYLGPDGGWHQMRNRGSGTAVIVHVLNMSPESHPHRYWRCDDGRIFDYPFEEISPGRWTARVVFDVDSGLGSTMPPDLGG